MGDCSERPLRRSFRTDIRRVAWAVGEKLSESGQFLWSGVPAREHGMLQLTACGARDRRDCTAFMCGAPLAAAELCRFRLCISDWPRNSYANTGVTNDRTTLVPHDTCAARYPDPRSGIHVPRRSGTLWSAARPFALSAGRCVPLTASAWARPASTCGADHTARGGTRTDRRSVCGWLTSRLAPAYDDGVDQQSATNGERQQYTSDQAPLPASTASR